MGDQSLLTGWVEPDHIHDKGWVLDWLMRLNPLKVKNCGSIDAQTGAWRFEFPDLVQARLPQSEIIYRPYALNENVQWKQFTPKQLVANFKARLEGRHFRVSYMCEPSPSVEEFPAWIAHSVGMMEECDKQGVLIDMWGIPAQHLKMFTNDPRDITKGGWDNALKVAGALRGRVLINIHCYTGLFAPAGTYDDSYLREIATREELLRDESTWATYEQIESRPFQTRHLFRDLWLNRRALEIGAPEHDLFNGETIYDYFGDEWDLQETWRHANAIAGSDLDVCLPDKRYVGGIRTLPNFTRWKTGVFQESIVKQLRWHGQIRARNPRYKGLALYMLSDKDGDQRPHNWLAHKDILDACVGLNPMQALITTTPAEPTPPAPPVIITPPVLCLVKPITDTLNVRSEPDINDNVVAMCKRGDELKVIAPENATEMLGKHDMWVKVITPKGVTGWCAAWLVELAQTPPVVEDPPVVIIPPVVETPPEPTPRYSGGEIKVLLIAMEYDPMGLLARLAQDAGLSRLLA